jgi:hypothetical protein
MKEPFKRWLKDYAETRGFQACGLRFPDRECVSHAREDGMTSEQMRDIWHSLADAAPHLASKNVAGQLQRWSFEHARVHFARRPDGVMFGVITGPEAGEGEVATVLENFLRFEPT